MTPADQAKLTPEALDEDETVILRANDPNAPDNVVLFSYELMEYHKVPVNAAQFHLTTHLDKSLGEIHHRESNDAKAQLAMQTQIAEKEKAVLEDIIKQGVYAEGETVEDTSALRNDFNFSDRSVQTIIHARKEVETEPEPPVTVEFSATATQWEIWDAYMAEFARAEAEEKRAKERAKSRSKKKQESGDMSWRKTVQANAEKKKDPLYSYEMTQSLKVMERATTQVSYDEILMDFMFYEDQSDRLHPNSASALPLWQFACPKVSKNKAVTSFCWNTAEQNMFAVGHGSYSFTRQTVGCVCVYSLSNPSFPDFTYTTPSGVMTLDFNTTLMPTLLVCGLYDGSIMVFDLGKRDPKTLGPEKAPVAQSTMSTGAHMDPVWQVQWSRENAYSFFTISSGECSNGLPQPSRRTAVSDAGRCCQQTAASWSGLSPPRSCRSRRDLSSTDRWTARRWTLWTRTIRASDGSARPASASATSSRTSSSLGRRRVTSSSARRCTRRSTCCASRGMT